MKLKTDNKQISNRYMNSRHSNNLLLNDEWLKEVIKKEKNFLQLSENENTLQQSLLDTLKEIPQGKF